MKITITPEAAKILGVEDLVITLEEQEFLRESNYIEDVRDEESFNQACIAWAYLRNQPKLTNHVVLKTHKLLMLNQKLRPDEKGYYRKVRVWIGYREGIPHYQIPLEMEIWLKAMNNSITDKYVDTVERKQGCAVALHVSYEHIHPFVDGNGRTGRMFMNWHLRKMGLPIKIIREEAKYEYYKWF